MRCALQLCAVQLRAYEKYMKSMVRAILCALGAPQPWGLHRCSQEPVGRRNRSCLRGFLQRRFLSYEVCVCVAEKIWVAASAVSLALVSGAAFADDSTMKSDQPVTDSYITVSYTHLRAHETRHDLVC